MNAWEALWFPLKPLPWPTIFYSLPMPGNQRWGLPRLMLFLRPWKSNQVSAGYWSELLQPVLPAQAGWLGSSERPLNKRHPGPKGCAWGVCHTDIRRFFRVSPPPAYPGFRWLFPRKRHVLRFSGHWHQNSGANIPVQGAKGVYPPRVGPVAEVFQNTCLCVTRRQEPSVDDYIINPDYPA